MTGEAGAEQWLQQIFNVLHYYYNQCRGLPGSLGVETKRSMVEEGLTITDITLCAPARQQPLGAPASRSLKHQVVTIEIKSDSALLKHLDEIEACSSRGGFKIRETQAMLNDGERMLAQVRVHDL